MVLRPHCVTLNPELFLTDVTLCFFNFFSRRIPYFHTTGMIIFYLNRKELKHTINLLHQLRTTPIVTFLNVCTFLCIFFETKFVSSQARAHAHTHTCTHTHKKETLGWRSRWSGGLMRGRLWLMKESSGQTAADKGVHIPQWATACCVKQPLSFFSSFFPPSYFCSNCEGNCPSWQAEISPTFTFA